MHDFIMPVQLAHELLRAITYMTMPGRVVLTSLSAASISNSPNITICCSRARTLYIQYKLFSSSSIAVSASAAAIVNLAGRHTHCVDGYQRCLHQRVSDGCGAMRMTTANDSKHEGDITDGRYDTIRDAILTCARKPT